MKNNNIKNLSFEEKIKLLTQNDKSYLTGYVDRALIGCRSSTSKKNPKQTA